MHVQINQKPLFFIAQLKCTSTPNPHFSKMIEDPRTFLLESTSVEFQFSQVLRNTYLSHHTSLPGASQESPPKSGAQPSRAQNPCDILLHWLVGIPKKD